MIDSLQFQFQFRARPPRNHHRIGTGGDEWPSLVNQRIDFSRPGSSQRAAANNFIDSASWCARARRKSA
jgi:hypothetical protein